MAPALAGTTACVLLLQLLLAAAVVNAAGIYLRPRDRDHLRNSSGAEAPRWGAATPMRSNSSRSLEQQQQQPRSMSTASSRRPGSRGNSSGPTKVLNLGHLGTGLRSGWTGGGDLNDNKQQQFVTRLMVNGCQLSVVRADSLGNLTVEPAMCVTQRPESLVPSYNPVTQSPYVSVPVMLTDDAALADAERQLRQRSLLEPQSTVKFAAVTDVSVAQPAHRPLAGVVAALDFVWSRAEAVGFLRLGCWSRGPACSTLDIVSQLRSGQFDIIERVNLSVTLAASQSLQQQQLLYRPSVQRAGFHDPKFQAARYAAPASCRSHRLLLRPVRPVGLGNCTAWVHRRADKPDELLVEPLLCHDATSLDQSAVLPQDGWGNRSSYRIELDLVLQSDAALAAVKAQLADLAPRSVAFMRLWQADCRLDLDLRDRLEVTGPLVTSPDESLARLVVGCRFDHARCWSLRSAIASDPVSFWKSIRWSLTSYITLDAKSGGARACLHESPRPRFAWRMSESAESRIADDRWSYLLTVVCPDPARCPYLRRYSGKTYLVIQQRMTGRVVSFQRGWADYEKGFGDTEDFWLGLSAIHAVSSKGATLVVQMKRVNYYYGSESDIQFANFTVGDASTGYRMTYGGMASLGGGYTDFMAASNGSQFSTMDRDNDLNESCSCSRKSGNAGWWFRACNATTFNPNGVMGRARSHVPATEDSMFWSGGNQRIGLVSVRLMLQLD